MTDAFRDLAHGARTLIRSRGFAAAAVLTLGLGIGANVAVFQLLDALLLQKLPVRSPDELAIVQLADTARWNGRRTTGYPVLSNPLWERFRDTQNAFAGVLAWANTDFRLGEPTASRPVRGLFVSGDFFNVLGVSAARGRVFTAGDDRPGCSATEAVISHDFWRTGFNRDPDVVGRVIAVNGRPMDVIGVTPEGFGGVEVGRSYDVAVPICSQPLVGSEAGWLTNGTLWWLTVMGRMAPEQSLSRINAQLEASSGQLFRATLSAGAPTNDTADYLSLQLRAVPAAEGVSALRTRFADPLTLLLVITVLVLLLVSTNLVILILARSSARRREFAVRIALGASVKHLTRQVAIEQGILAFTGAAAGLALGAWWSRMLLDVLGPDVSVDLGLSGPLVVAVMLLTIATALTFGLVPAMSAARSSLQTIVSGARGTSPGAEGLRPRSVLVTLQIGVSLVLLFGAFLFGGTLRNLLSADPGFQYEGVTVARLNFSNTTVPQEARSTFKRELLERIRRVPGITSAAEVRHLPLSGTGSSALVSSESAPEKKTAVRVNGITDGYLETMRIRLLAGRDFTERDSATAPSVAIVNPEFAKRIGIAGNPVGARFRMGESNTPVEIVGLVPNTRHFSLREDVLPIAFVPMPQVTDPRRFTDFVLRAANGVSPALREAVSAAGRDAHVDFTTFESAIERGVIRERLMAMLSAFFGAVAVLIAVVGLYGVMVELVSRRRAEIGLRIALGAATFDILGMVLRQAGTLVAMGLGIGAVVVVVAADSLRVFVYGVQPQDLTTLLAACAVLAGTAFAAIAWPAWRAATLEPLSALRQE